MLHHLSTKFSTTASALFARRIRELFNFALRQVKFNFMLDFIFIHRDSDIDSLLITQINSIRFRLHEFGLIFFIITFSKSVLGDQREVSFRQALFLNQIGVIFVNWLDITYRIIGDGKLMFCRNLFGFKSCGFLRNISLFLFQLLFLLSFFHGIFKLLEFWLGI